MDVQRDYSVQRSNRAIATAVHDSIMDIRSISRGTPLAWAPYIHLGCITRRASAFNGS